MHPSYGLLSHVPTQSLFDTNIGMMQTISTCKHSEIFIDHKELDAKGILKNTKL